MNQFEYPHEKFMRDNALTMRHLPQDIKNAITTWQMDWKDVSPKTAKNASLFRSSNFIVEAVEEWLNESEDDDAPTKKDTIYKDKDGILHNLYTSGKTNATEAELIAAGYKKEGFGMLKSFPKTQAHYCLKAVKGTKATWQICKR